MRLGCLDVLLIYFCGDLLLLVLLPLSRSRFTRGEVDCRMDGWMVGLSEVAGGLVEGMVLGDCGSVLYVARCLPT